MSELKPCPFCGGKAEVGFSYGDWIPELDEHKEVWGAECQECGALGPDRDTKKEGAEAWNTRTEPRAQKD